MLVSICKPAAARCRYQGETNVVPAFNWMLVSSRFPTLERCRRLVQIAASQRWLTAFCQCWVQRFANFGPMFNVYWVVILFMTRLAFLIELILKHEFRVMINIRYYLFVCRIFAKIILVWLFWRTRSNAIKCIKKKIYIAIIKKQASWSSGNAFVSGAGGLRFKSRAGQIGHSVSNGSPPLHHFFERSCVARAQWRGDGPRQLVIRFAVFTVSKMKDLIRFDNKDFATSFDILEEMSQYQNFWLNTKWRFSKSTSRPDPWLTAFSKEILVVVE